MNQFAFAKNPTNELANFYLSAASCRSSRRAQNFLHYAGLLARRQVAVATTIFPSVQSAVAAPLFFSFFPQCQVSTFELLYIFVSRCLFPFLSKVVHQISHIATHTLKESNICRHTFNFGGSPNTNIFQTLFNLRLNSWGFGVLGFWGFGFRV